MFHEFPGWLNGDIYLYSVNGNYGAVFLGGTSILGYPVGTHSYQSGIPRDKLQ